MNKASKQAKYSILDKLQNITKKLQKPIDKLCLTLQLTKENTIKDNVKNGNKTQVVCKGKTLDSIKLYAKNNTKQN